MAGEFRCDHLANYSRAILWVRGGPADGTATNLGEGTTIMGRAVGNDIMVEESSVSRQHAGIRTDEVGYWIEDLGSRNGTFVNGEELEGEGRRLHDLGRIELRGATGIHWIFREQDATVGIALPHFG